RRRVEPVEVHVADDGVDRAGAGHEVGRDHLGAGAVLGLGGQHEARIPTKSFMKFMVVVIDPGRQPVAELGQEPAGDGLEGRAETAGGEGDVEDDDAPVERARVGERARRAVDEARQVGHAPSVSHCDMTGAMRALACLICLVAATASAQEPKFEYGKKEEVKEVEWKATASAGVIATTGNSRTVTLSGSALISRKDGDNKIALEAAGAYARSDILVFTDADMSGTIGPGEIDRQDSTTVKNWLLKLR